MIGNVNNSLSKLYTVAAVQKNGVEQTKNSVAQAKETVKDTATTVAISREAKELMQIYANSYNNTANTSESSGSTQSTSTVDTAKLLEKVDNLQQRQVRQAFLENDSNRPEKVKPTPLPAGSKVNEYA